MDLSKALKSGYYQALYPEIGVPVYDAFSIPENAAYPYVIISNITTNEIQNLIDGITDLINTTIYKLENLK